MATLHVLEERTYTNRAGTKILTAKDKLKKGEGRVLLGTPGDEISIEKAEELGLLKKATPAEDKKAKPVEDKALKPGENK